MRWSRVVSGNLRQRKGRAFVSIASVAIGVTVFLSMSIATRDVRETIASASEMAVFQNNVSLRPTGVFDSYAPHSAIEPLRSLPGVELVLGAVSTNAVIDIGGDRQSISFGGWDSNSVDHGLLPAPGAAEMAVGEGLAAIGDTVRVEAIGGQAHDAVVTGTIEVRRGSSGFAITSRETLASWLGVGDAVNHVVVVLAGDVDAHEWLVEHRSDLGPFQPATGVFDADAVEFFRSVDESVAPLAAASLFVAGYLIFLTLGRAVQDRATTLATLRAIGTSRRQLVGLVLGEAAVLGAIGTVLGLALGLVLSWVVTAAMHGIFGVEMLGDGKVSLPPSTFAIAVVLGMLTPLAAAALPAIRAARTDPAANLRGTVATPASNSVPRLGIGAALFVAGAAGAALVPSTAKGLPAIVALGGAVLALPVVGQPIGAGLTRVWSRVRPGPGELAAQEMARRPGRSAQTSALLATVLIVSVVVATIAASQRPALDRAIDAHYGADADVHGVEGVGVTDAQLAALAADPAVRAISPGAEGTVLMTDPGGRAETLRVVDPATYFEVAGMPWSSGTDGDAAIESLRRGEVVMAGSIAMRLGVDVGDEVHLQTTSGPVPFRVGGLFDGLGWGQTVAVAVSTDVARMAFGLTSTPFARVDLHDGVDVDEWAQSKTELVVEPTAEIRAAIRRSSAGITNMAYALLVIAVLVGVMGLANTLAMDMLDRRREIGLLRAMGLHRREVRSMVLAQALVLTAVAGVMAVVLGSILGAAFVTQSGTPNRLTMSMTYVFPVESVPVIVVAAVIVGAIAGLTPARIAARLDPTDALRLPVEA